jgi:TetR/AcrR family transcriptional regulator
MGTNDPRPAPSATATPRMRKADRRKQLLAHAKQLFVRLGYHETTTDKIARAAGVSEPVLYRHFESKKALFLAVLQEIREATLNRYRDETAHLPDPLAKLHKIADIYLGTTREHALEFRILHRSLVESSDPEIAALLREIYVETESLLAQVIHAGQQAGVFRRSLDPRIGAWELIRTALGYTLTLPLGIPLYEEPDHIPKATDCMLHCLLKTDV